MLAGRYELAEELGRGGMGRVVMAHDRALGRDVAVKLLDATDDPTARERFLREARSAARLHHPNVVAVYDTGEEDGRPYLVTELVKGRSLAELLRSDGPMEVDDAIGVTLGVLEGLAAAHRAGMVHRDVKPANVLLPDEGGVKLSDFGIAKALDDAAAELTAAGSIMGTPTYLAPELLAGVPPSPASDLYSVGCLLYAQLTGSPPFATGEPLTIAYAHRNEPVPPIERERPDLPTDLVAVVARALEKDPADRFDSATAMRTALIDGPTALPGGETTGVTGPAEAPREATQVLGGSDGPTRALDAAPAPAPARPTATHPPSPTRQRGGRRWIVALLVLVVIAALTWALWTVLAGDDDLGDVPEAEDETQQLDEEPDAPIEAPDDGPDGDPPAEQPPTDTSPTDPPPAQDPPTDPPPAEEPPAEEPPAEEPPAEEPPAEEPPAEEPPAEDGD